MVNVAECLWSADTLGHPHDRSDHTRLRMFLIRCPTQALGSWQGQCMGVGSTLANHWSCGADRPHLNPLSLCDILMTSVWS
ncbi:hypothetical protein U0070_013677 [Myodes glareolus]|uniref:Uncharacterized protein n=1 Tax=Myodes glareolus TaxID=447135 RepID=A0AAW0JPQ0_MYOGA